MVFSSAFGHRMRQILPLPGKARHPMNTDYEVRNKPFTNVRKNLT
jgi:hypothetical protein